MNDRPKIVIVGGGSLTFSPKLINDFLLTPGLEKAHYELLDIKLAAAEKIAELGRKLNSMRGTECTFNHTDNQKEALRGADFVLITISTGGLDAMQFDLSIPEDYGIYQTVGDTVGPGGWARALRNIPVFVGLAGDIETICPDAFVLNYTNPLSVLTNVFYKTTKLKATGLCHGMFEVYDRLIDIFNLESRDDVQVNFGGVNHFVWIIDLKIKGEDGFELLHKKLNGGSGQKRRSWPEMLDELYKDKEQVHPLGPLFDMLYERFGILMASEDRHSSEFFPNYLTGDIRKLDRYKLVRTSIEDRRGWMRDKAVELNAYIAGEKKLPDSFSGEAAAGIISAIVNKKSRIDVVNVPNIGQISNLPRGTIVETLGVTDNIGFRPLCAGELPEPVAGFIMPHAQNQNLIIEAGLEADIDKAMCALYNDPLCAHLDLHDIKEMGLRLIKSQKSMMPPFKL